MSISLYHCVLPSAPQIRFHEFWRHINLHVCTCSLISNPPLKAATEPNTISCQLSFTEINFSDRLVVYSAADKHQTCLNIRPWVNSVSSSRQWQPTQHVSQQVKSKGKGSPYSNTEHTVQELILVLCSQPARDESHIPGSRLPLLSIMPSVTLAALKRVAVNFAARWTEERWMWTVCLRLSPDSVAAAIRTRFLLRLSPARYNHSATEPPNWNATRTELSAANRNAEKRVSEATVKVNWM